MTIKREAECTSDELRNRRMLGFVFIKLGGKNVKTNWSCNILQCETNRRLMYMQNKRKGVENTDMQTTIHYCKVNQVNLRAVAIAVRSGLLAKGLPRWNKILCTLYPNVVQEQTADKAKLSTGSCGFLYTNSRTKLACRVCTLGPPSDHSDHSDQSLAAIKTMIKKKIEIL